MKINYIFEPFIWMLFKKGRTGQTNTKSEDNITSKVRTYFESFLNI